MRLARILARSATLPSRAAASPAQGSALLERGYATAAAIPSRPRSAAGREITIVEVGPRDGLQNEKRAISAETKLELISRLADAGLRRQETGSFVNPKAVPQMASTADVLAGMGPITSKYPDFQSIVLVPNAKGMELYMDTIRKLEGSQGRSPADEIALFAAASESFSQANTRCSIAESVKRFEKVTAQARAAGVRMRGYVSVAAGCPFEGAVDPKVVASLTRDMLDLGCFEVSIADTIGIGSPAVIENVLNALAAASIPFDKLAAHCHDTFNTGLANTLTMVNCGIPSVDAAIGGLGGCPFSPGATGNLATEDAVFALRREGYTIAGLPSINPDEPIDSSLEALAEIGAWISAELQKPNASNVGKAVLSKLERKRAQEQQARL